MPASSQLSDPSLPQTTQPVEDPIDHFGQIETRGIDRIPENERHGTPRELFWIWAASNTNYLSLLLGGLLMVIGLNVWQGLAIVFLGNLFWVFVGIMAISGPASGTPSSVITRAMFGIRGNRAFVALANWPTYIAYEALNLAIGALAGFAFVEELGLSANKPIQFVVVVVTSVATLAISVYGHATIVKMSGLFTVILTASMIVLGGYIVANANFGYSAGPDNAPSGSLFWATALIGIVIIAASPISWGISADYARYLPAESSNIGVISFTALGGYVPSVIMGSLGVLAGSVVDMSEAQKSLSAILPGWFYPVFLLIIVVSSMTNNVLVMYSSGLALQAIGFPLRRTISVFIDGILGVAVACYAIFISNFTDTLSSILQLTVALLGPVMAIYIADLVLRRNLYDGVELHDETQGSAFWYSGGTNWAGMIALVLGTTAATLCLSATEYTGPIAKSLNGADLSVFVGPAVAAALYIGLMKLMYGGFGQRSGAEKSH